jgi:3-oxoacyl-[acyl-carrier protein] reductase
LSLRLSPKFPGKIFQDMVLGELAGIYFPAKAVAPLMVQRKHGHLIAISSGLGRLSLPGTIAHAAGKSGVDAMARVLAQEYGPHGIRVNTIAPGKVMDGTADQGAEIKQLAERTIPLGYIAQAEDIAGAIYLLALKESQYITGAYIPVNGGSHMP